MNMVVVDTNVLLVAAGLAAQSGPTCRVECGQQLRSLMTSGMLCLDGEFEILGEYCRYFGRLKGEQGPAHLFLKWAMTNQHNPKRVARVSIQRKPYDSYDFHGLPDGNPFDPSDRKFIAVAVTHARRPPVLQAADSKWLGWKEMLSDIGVQVHYLCKRELAATFERKRRRT